MFKQIKESNYEISDKGVLRNRITKKVLKYHLNHHGYYKVQIDIGEGKKDYFVHRLIAMVFLTKIEGKDYINHINSNKLDNRVENLEWCTVQENNAHAYINNLNMAKKKAVIGKNINTGEIVEFDSLYQAAKYVSNKNFNEKQISSVSYSIKLCCIGKLKTTKGYKWEYNNKKENWLCIRHLE